MSIKNIRGKYGLPVKVGDTLRIDGQDVVVIFAPSMYLKVRYSSGKTEVRHPFDFDYCIGGYWMSGDQLKNEYNQRVDRWNAWLNRKETVNV